MGQLMPHTFQQDDHMLPRVTWPSLEKIKVGVAVWSGRGSKWRRTAWVTGGSYDASGSN